MNEDPRNVENNDPTAGAGVPVMPNLTRLEKTNKVKKGQYYYFKYNDERPFVFLGKYKGMSNVYGLSIKIVTFEDVTRLNNGEHYDNYEVTSDGVILWNKPAAGGARRRSRRGRKTRRRTSRKN